MNTPYPGYAPNYKSVTRTGGLHRSCIIVELLSTTPLNDAELAAVKERLEAALQHRPIAALEKTEVVLPIRFDTTLRAGLRL